MQSIDLRTPLTVCTNFIGRTHVLSSRHGKDAELNGALGNIKLTSWLRFPLLNRPYDTPEKASSSTLRLSSLRNRHGGIFMSSIPAMLVRNSSHGKLFSGSMGSSQQECSGKVVVATTRSKITERKRNQADRQTWGQTIGFCLLVA